MFKGSLDYAEAKWLQLILHRTEELKAQFKDLFVTNVVYDSSTYFIKIELNDKSNHNVLYSERLWSDHRAKNISITKFKISGTS